MEQHKDNKKKLPSLHDKIVLKLSNDLKPISFKKPFTIFLLWFLPSISIAFLFALFMGWRPDLNAKFHTLSFLLGWSALFLAMIASSWFAIKMSLPGQEPKKYTRIFILMIPFVFMAYETIRLGGYFSWKLFLHDLHFDYPCTLAIFVISFIPLMILSFLTSRLAPLKPFWTAWIIATATMLLGSLIVELHCAIENGCHLALWHYFPVFVFSFLIALPLQRFLRKWKSKLH